MVNPPWCLTASLALKIGGWETTFRFGMACFQGFLSFREWNDFFFLWDEFLQMKLKIGKFGGFPRHTNKKIADKVDLSEPNTYAKKRLSWEHKIFQLWMNLAQHLCCMLIVGCSGFSKKVSLKPVGRLPNCCFPRRSKSNVSSMSGKTYEAGRSADVIHEHSTISMAQMGLKWLFSNELMKTS